MNYSKCSAMLKAGQRPSGLDYKSYAALAKSNGDKPLSNKDYLAKAEAEDEGEGDAEEPDGDEGGEGAGDGDGDEGPEPMGKGEVDPDALSKALDAYTAVEDATALAGGSRETYLTARMEAGTLTKSERAELGRIWAGETEDTDEPMRKSVDEELHDLDAASGEMVDASDFLSNLVKSVDNALTGFSSEIGKEFRATRQLQSAQGGLVKAIAQDNIALRKTLRKSAAVIDALAERLQIVETQPVGRKSVATRHDPRAITQRQLAKGAAGGDQIVGEDNGEPLTKSEISQGLDQLMKSAVEHNDQPAVDRIVHETAKHESYGQIAKSTEQAIRQLRRSNSNA